MSQAVPTRSNAAPVAPHIEDLKQSIIRNIQHHRGKLIEDATLVDVYHGLSLAVRNVVLDAFLEAERSNRQTRAKRVHYLSMEFLIGKLLENNLINVGLLDSCREAVTALGYDLNDVLDKEIDPALGNGGLGRLAACFLDSMATLGIAATGYGINYEYGLFRQSISNGYQQEAPDHWTVHGCAWQVERPNEVCVVPVYGRVIETVDRDGHYNPTWMNWKVILGVPHDMPVVGFGGSRTNMLRLYSARSSDDFDMKIFNDGDYMSAVQEKIASETISKVLYPEDSQESGKELRLLQEYFFVACALRDIVKQHLDAHGTIGTFHQFHAIQLNDTHPALAVAELMRMLVDEHSVSWERAWEITVDTCAYTNHTLLPEALECWPASLMERVVPRHFQIIREIDARLRSELEHTYPGDMDKINRMAIVTYGNDQPETVRMANLSIAGSHSVNGVAALHSELVKSRLVPDFYQHWPHRFNNKTNGVTQRRWLLQANPGLARLITNAIGDGWITDLDELTRLEAYAEDTGFQDAFQQVKDEAKRRLASVIYNTTRISVDTDTVFDMQVKRVHEYKRQLLNALHIIHQYLSIVEDGTTLASPKTYVFAGKAAPGYFIAKRIIKLINNLASVINQDARVRGQLKVAFVPDYKVSLAERIFPAGDVSEQISTAGFEASGTGNMKFTLNGALTLGTLDGANIEIREEVGPDNIYIFGHRSDEIQQMRESGSYQPWDIYHNDPSVKRVMDALRSDLFSPGEPELFEPIHFNLLSGGDYFCLLADFADYVKTQARLEDDYRERAAWRRRAILNVARSGKFSSDRTIADYARDIWGV